MKHKTFLFKANQITVSLLITLLPIQYCFSQGDDFPEGQNAYSVQMHLHGMSNHNGNKMPGSYQWHTFFADTSETDVLWWSEHINVFTQKKSPQFTFTNGVYVSSVDEIQGLNGDFNRLPVKWQMSNNGGVKGIYFNDTTLSLSIKAKFANEKFYTAKPVGNEGKLKDSQYFVRPLVSTPYFEFYLKPIHLNNSGKNKIQFKITLDFHHYSGVSRAQSIIFNFVAPPAVYSEYLVDSFTVMQNIPVIPDTVNFISLNLKQSAHLLRDYKDNCTSEYLLGVYASQIDSVRAEFSKMKIYSTIQSPQVNYQAMNQLVKAYVSPYNVGEYIGTEYSANGPEQHINAFVPETLGNKYIIYRDSNFTATEFISRIHFFGGAASYNHPFGLDLQFNPGYDSTKIDSFALIYLENKLFGADILEVGYVARGGFNMEQHFSLWDKLTANKVFIYGNATSDLHGGNWYNSINHWATFIWADDSATQNLVAGMVTGRMYGADNLKYNGLFDFSVANGKMGDCVITDTLVAPILVSMDNVLPGSTFKFTQGLIQDGLQVTYLHHNEVMDPDFPPTVSLELPCFIRVVVYDSTGKEYLFSNPVVFGDSTIVIEKDNRETIAHKLPFKLNVTFNEPLGKSEASLFSESEQNITLEIYDTGGKLVCTRSGIKVYKGKNRLPLPCENLRPGVYVMKSFNNTGMSGATFIVPPTNFVIDHHHGHEHEH